LKIIAAHVGQFWNNWLMRCRINDENGLWRSVVEGVSDANRSVIDALGKEVPDVSRGVEHKAWEALGLLVKKIDDSQTNAVIDDNLTRGVAVRGGEAVASETITAPAATMRDMLNRQIALYRDLANNVQARYRAQADLREASVRQTRTYLDLAHQLKTPILSAYRRANAAVQRGLSDDNLKADLLKMRGLCAKARTVTLSVKLFADLAKTEALAVSLAPLRTDDIRKMVIETADDTQATVEASRQLRFDVDRTGFGALQSNRVMGDRDLIQQAVSNLLDNAGKYSRSGTTIRVAAGITSSGRFHISVSNKPAFRAKDADKWKDRGYRSEEAESVTADGTGLGLWIVNCIMEAHNGELLIIPSNQEGLTEVKLLFPILK
jgi:signal transduction histidine kinase